MKFKPSSIADDVFSQGNSLTKESVVEREEVVLLKEKRATVERRGSPCITHQGTPIKPPSLYVIADHGRSCISTFRQQLAALERKEHDSVAAL